MMCHYLRSQQCNQPCFCVTRMVGQCLSGAVFTWGNQVPNEAFDVLIPTIMQQAVSQQGSADCFHICLLQRALEAAMSQDVTPPAPAKHTNSTGPSLNMDISNKVSLQHIHNRTWHREVDWSEAYDKTQSWKTPLIKLLHLAFKWPRVKKNKRFYLTHDLDLAADTSIAFQ